MLNFIKYQDKPLWCEQAIKSILKRSFESGFDHHNQFTPFQLCNEVVSKLEKHYELTSESRVLVLANLEFLYIIKLYYQQKSLQLDGIYFATPCDLKAKAACQWIPEQNIIKYQYNNLKESFMGAVNGRKFDVVVGNPPYQNGNVGSNRILYDRFYECIVQLRPTYAAIITPTIWLYSRAEKLCKVRRLLFSNNLIEVNHFNSQSTLGVIVDHIGVSYFNTNESNSTIVIKEIDGNSTTVTSTTKLGTKGEIIKGNNNIHNLINRIESQCDKKLLAKRGSRMGIRKNGVPYLGRDDVRSIQDSTFCYPIYNRILKNGTPEIIFSKIPPKNNNNQYRILFNYISPCDRLGKLCIDCSNTDISIAISYVPCNQESLDGIQSWLQSSLFAFILAAYKAGVNNTLGVLRQIPLPNHLSDTKTSQQWCQYFNLSEEEIQLIEETVK